MLNSVCQFKNGFSFKSSSFKNEGEPILRITNIHNGMIDWKNLIYFNKKDYKEDLSSYEINYGDIVIAMSGATTGKVGCNLTNKTFFLNQRVGKFIPEQNKLDKRYLFHWLTSKEKDILNISSGTGAQPNLSSKKMMEFLIPLPPLEIQKAIGFILDLFDKLVNNLSEGLPAEIKLREQQYEYYRDLLLSFRRN